MGGFVVAKIPLGLLKPMTHNQRAKGEWVGGVYQEEPNQTQNFRGHITPLTDQDLKYDVNGTYTKSDYKLYCEVQFLSNTKVTYLGRTWEIQGPLDYLDLGTFRRYVIRRVGVTGES